MKDQAAAVFIVLAMASVVTGCARQPAVSSGAVPIEHIEQSEFAERNVSWWYARFKITWPENYPPDGAVDLFLADTVIRPILETYSSKLFRWRFHRRAARDIAGHQFSFIFYASPDVARDIFERIKSNDRLTQAVSSHIIEKVRLDDPEKPARPALADTSDRSWPGTLQKHWPAYIMGVSALWLGLIDEYKDKTVPDGKRDIQALVDAYRDAEEKITNIWYQHGQHALLHHLNAIFGYEPILIRKELTF